VLEPVEDGLIGEHRVFHNLSVVRHFLYCQSFEFDKKTRILHEHFLNLTRGRGQVRIVILGEIGRIGRAFRRGYFAIAARLFIFLLGPCSIAYDHH
jgi:hypothetical protein